MDGFLLLVRRHSETWDAPALTEQVRVSIAQIAENQTVGVITDEHIIFASVRAGFASDAHLRQQPQLTYVQGFASNLERGQSITSHSILEDVSDALNTPDVEVLKRAVQNLSGSFFAIVHSPNHTVIALDRLLSRPIFTTTTRNAIVFASDIRLLLALPDVDQTLDEDALVQFMRTQMVFEDRTLYREIRMMPAASIWRMNHETGEVDTLTYWTIQRLNAYRTLDEAIEGHIDAFVSAAGRVIAGRDRLSIFLSGGMDSRMLVGSLLKNIDADELDAHTFQFGKHFEVETAKNVAEAVGITWHVIDQTVQSYWEMLPNNINYGNGLYSFYHTHTYYTATQVAARGYDMGIEGWGLDLFYSGSYFPRRERTFLGRPIYTFALEPMRSPAHVLDYVHGEVDRHDGKFENSVLTDKYRSLWENSTRAAMERLIKRSQALSDDPLDWIDTLFFGFGVAKFRSYPMALGIRRNLRQRNLMFENDVIEVFQRTPSKWRYQGQAYRRALLRINPALIRVPYANTHSSLLAPLWRQALRANIQAFTSANIERLKQLGYKARLLPKPKPIVGNYPYQNQVTADIQSAYRIIKRHKKAQFMFGSSDIVRFGIPLRSSGAKPFSTSLSPNHNQTVRAYL